MQQWFKNGLRNTILSWRGQSNRASVRCAGQTVWCTKAQPHKLQALLLISWHQISHLQKSRQDRMWIRSIMVAKAGSTQYEAGCYNFMVDGCMYGRLWLGGRLDGKLLTLTQKYRSNYTSKDIHAHHVSKSVNMWTKRHSLCVGVYVCELTSSDWHFGINQLPAEHFNKQLCVLCLKMLTLLPQFVNHYTIQRPRSMCK